VSITPCFDRRLPIARDIAAYQNIASTLRGERDRPPASYHKNGRVITTSRMRLRLARYARCDHCATILRLMRHSDVTG